MLLLLDTLPDGGIIKDVMSHPFGEREEPKKPPNTGARPARLKSSRLTPATDTEVFDEIDPADFWDPEEFGIRREVRTLGT